MSSQDLSGENVGCLDYVTPINPTHVQTVALRVDRNAEADVNIGKRKQELRQNSKVVFLEYQ
jgi:hypothetical protein